MVKKNQDRNKEYARAPYNFIPFPEKIFYRHTILKDYIDENKGITILPTHNIFRKDLKTGYINYSIKVETPLFISDGKKESDFFKVNGEYTIPGSTVRGRIRSNAEILSCSYPEFIEDKKLWFRGAFSKDVLKEMYEKAVLSGETGRINDRVKAGYLHRKGSRWFITPAKQDSNNKFFREIHESQLRNKHKNIDENIRNNIFMYNFKDKKSGEKLWNLVKEIKDEKGKINKKINKKEEELSSQEKKELQGQIKNLQERIENLLKNNERGTFKPYYYKASYYLKDNNQPQITKVVESTADESYGILMNSSRLNNKQNHYLIFRKDNEKLEKEISRRLINQYKTSVQYRNKKVEVENFKISEDKVFIDEKEKPVFYITDDKENIIAFGFTPYLKIPYEKSVWDGIKTKKDNDKEIKNGKIDYAKAIFGFTNFKYNNLNEDSNSEISISYKGRVSFTNAKPIKEYCRQVEKPIYKHLMNPKISSFQLYLKQEVNDPKKLKTYNNDFELRGGKFYWLRDKHDIQDDYERELQEYENKKRKSKPTENQYARLYAVDRGSRFKGRIYFENLYKDELGLLLMSIEPFEDAKENLGQGKPYGYGQVSFQIEDIVEIDSKKRFTSLNISLNEKSIAENKDEYIKDFIDYMKRQNINVDFDNEYMYTCFYSSKSQVKKISEKEFNYMEIKEFTSRNILKSMESYIHDDDNIASTKQVALTKEDNEENDLDAIEKILSSKFKTKRIRKK